MGNILDKSEAALCAPIKRVGLGRVSDHGAYPLARLLTTSYPPRLAQTQKQRLLARRAGQMRLM